MILGGWADQFAALISAGAPDLNIFISRECGQDAREAAPRVEIILGFRFPPEILRWAANLRWVQLTSVGAEQLINSPDLKDDVVVTVARGIHHPQIGEYTIGVMLALARGLPQVVRNQERKIWKQWAGVSLAGRRLGLIGLGAVGSEIARLARGLGMRVTGLRRSGRPHPLVDRLVGPKQLIELLGESDFVVVAVPLTARTRGLIGDKEFKAMKGGAYLINIARGEVVDEMALMDALRRGAIAGAALDVFEEEPLGPESPLWETPNLLITPHISGLSRDYAGRVAELFLENYRRFKRGETLLHVVSREEGY